MLRAIQRQFFLLGLRSILRKQPQITSEGAKRSVDRNEYLVSLPPQLGSGFVTGVTPDGKQIEASKPFPRDHSGKRSPLTVYRVPASLEVLLALKIKGPCYDVGQILFGDELTFSEGIRRHLTGYYVLRQWRDQRKGKRFDQSFTAIDESFIVLSTLAEADAFYTEVFNNTLLEKLYGSDVSFSVNKNKLSLRLYKLLKGLQSRGFIEIPLDKVLVYSAKITPEGLFKLESMRQERLAEKHRQKHDRKTVSIARWAMIAAMCSAIGTGIQACSTSTKTDIKKPERVIIPLPIPKETTHNQH